jgi:chromate transporter
MRAVGHPDASPSPRRAGEVFWLFLRLGLTSFGGPTAHLGYFRQAMVVRRGWLNEATYGELLAICQFLPGPASSQVAFGLGLGRAGLLGGVAAWLGFSLPSMAIMIAFAFGIGAASGPMGSAVLHGLKLVAVAIVAQAVLGMARTLTPDLARAGIALAALAAVSLPGAAAWQPVVIGSGALAGLMLCRGLGKPGQDQHPAPALLRRRTGVVALGLFLAFLLVPPWFQLVAPTGLVGSFDAFYRTGALVFGGGHVVLPLLHQAVVAPGWIDEQTFLSGYGAAQALPGPLFSFAAFLGTLLRHPPNGVWGGVLAAIALSLPGLLAVAAALPFWRSLSARPQARAAIAGANAAVVGILAGALYNPISTTAIASPIDLALAAAGFGILTVARAPPLAVVVLGVASGLIRAALS